LSQNVEISSLKDELTNAQKLIKEFRVKNNALYEQINGIKLEITQDHQKVELHEIEMEKTRQLQVEKIAVLQKQLDDQVSVNQKMLVDLRHTKSENTRIEKRLKFNFLSEL
jgi:hypothetical protein